MKEFYSAAEVKGLLHFRAPTVTRNSENLMKLYVRVGGLHLLAVDQQDQDVHHQEYGTLIILRVLRVVNFIKAEFVHYPPLLPACVNAKSSDKGRKCHFYPPQDGGQFVSLGIP